MEAQKTLNGADRIPTPAECNELMARYFMRPNIIEHSLQVMRVSLAITDHLMTGVSVNRDLVIAGSLLHDITKTRSLQTKEHHDASGGALLRDLGFPSTAEIVEQHIRIQNLNLEAVIDEKEIVYYADKRVMHDTIVTVEERLHDLLQRYGAEEETRNMILRNREQVFAVETKIAGLMKIDLHNAIQTVTLSSYSAGKSLGG